MRANARVRLGRLVLAASVGAIVAGCAAPVPVAGGEGVVVARMERPAWNAPPEPGLFRITFDARRAGEIRREAATSQAPEGVDAYTGEGWILEREAGNELRTRGFCNGTAKLVTYLDEGDGRSAISALFKCRASIF